MITDSVSPGSNYKEKSGLTNKCFGLFLIIVYPWSNQLGLVMYNEGLIPYMSEQGSLDEDKLSRAGELTSLPHSTTTHVPGTLAAETPTCISTDPFSLIRFISPLLRKS